MVEGWKQEKMEDICNVNQGLQIAISRREKYCNKDNKIYITIQYLKDKKQVEYISSKDYSESVICNKDDILMTRTGNTGVVITNEEGVFHNNFFKINYDRKKINKDYLVYYLNRKEIQKMILAKAGTSTIPDLNHNDFYSLPIIYPEDINEQKEIVRTLNDIDNIIKSLQLLIDKKENIKIGTMKKLIIEKEDTISKKLEDLLKYEQPVKYIVSSTDYVENGTPVLTAGKTFILGYTNETQNIYNKGNCIIFDDFTTEIKYVNFKFKVKSSAMKILTPSNDNICLEYMYYLMKMIKYEAKDHQRQWISIYSEFEVNIPKTYEEQKKIADIILNMDKEINNIKEEIEKYKKIKEGMMELLLTGKVKLINNKINQSNI